jgi:hypothetical protein
MHDRLWPVPPGSLEIDDPAFDQRENPTGQRSIFIPSIYVSVHKFRTGLL